MNTPLTAVRNNVGLNTILTGVAQMTWKLLGQFQIETRSQMNPSRFLAGLP